MNPWCAGSAACGSGATGSGSAACGSSVFDPVHSRKLPHDPQKLSVPRFWYPHLVQTIT
jgi:hypothetical protein